MFNEFRAFIARGNVIDLAVGIIIGAAFTAIVNSLVTDLINPIIGVVTGGIDFSNLFINLGAGEYASLAAARAAGAPVFAYGSFITAIINFLIIAWVVFLLVKAVNKVTAANKKAEEPTAPAGPTQEELLAQIRDLLAAKG
ncbi:Branched-chain amino acid aminotransferase [Ketogulonicigenium robustum]|uniref:Large-conductance mechanosensitive channel n=1 Tax=Ketogulonicigenium robustum TaxID=92947 RepID=A0A1W6NWJ3_9RHOB|nr:large conductance mechanosensitive channel protein MscL [Ketogulonicigenium robustum]ARO13592.1 Branched-chain amino acid aminotransferase [Ketogulonicigenium robustum]